MGEMNKRPTEKWLQKRLDANVCARCGQQNAVTNQQCCKDCRKRNNKRSEELRSKRLSQGFCVKCGQEPHRHGKTSCEKCRVKYREWYHAKKNKFTDKGICVACRKRQSRKGSLVCQACIDYTKLNKRKLKEKRKAEGMCRKCGTKPSLHNACCEICCLRCVSSKNLGTEKRWREIGQLLVEQNNKCAYTGILIYPGKNASLDHIRPKGKGGSNDISNLQWVHTWINWAKYDLDESEFIEKLDSFLRDVYSSYSKKITRS